MPSVPTPHHWYDPVAHLHRDREEKEHPEMEVLIHFTFLHGDRMVRHLPFLLKTGKSLPDNLKRDSKVFLPVILTLPR